MPVLRELAEGRDPQTLHRRGGGDGGAGEEHIPAQSLATPIAGSQPRAQCHVSYKATPFLGQHRFQERRQTAGAQPVIKGSLQQAPYLTTKPLLFPPFIYEEVKAHKGKEAAQDGTEGAGRGKLCPKASPRQGPSGSGHRLAARCSGHLTPAGSDWVSRFGPSGFALFWRTNPATLFQPP